MRKVPFCDDINSVKCNRRKLKRGDSVLQKTGRHAFFFFYASVVSTVVFGLVVKDFLLFEYRTPTTLHVVQTTAVSRRNANLHFSFFSLHYFSSGSSLQLFPPTGTHLPKSVQMSGHVHYIFVCVCVVACLHCFVWPFWSGCHSVINHQA